MYYELLSTRQEGRSELTAHDGPRQFSTSDLSGFVPSMAGMFTRCSRPKAKARHDDRPGFERQLESVGLSGNSPTTTPN